MLSAITKYTSSFFNLFYPNVCLVCSHSLLNGESVTCFRCQAALPQTNFWTDPENKMMKRFWGRVDVKGAVALYHFNKGEGVQQLIHELKYRGRKDVGEYVGRQMGYKLLEPGSIIKHVDLVVPVPLHWKKLKSRGYNQCDYFAKGVAEVMNISWAADALIRHSENISQTKKQRHDRWNNVAEIFGIENEGLLKGKHILLVDDVVTTGATAEACLQTIIKVTGTSASFASIAAAER